MSVFKSLAHSRWDCKYHVVFIPKGRKKELYGKIREYLKQVFHGIRFATIFGVKSMRNTRKIKVAFNG